jgi:hypothetical protein
MKNINDIVKIVDRGEVEFKVCGGYMNERNVMVYEVIEEGDDNSFEVLENDLI